MVAQSLLENILLLPPADRIERIHRVWDSLVDDGVDVPLTDEQRLELDRRYEEYLASPDKGDTWEDVKAFVRSRFGR